MAEPLLQTQDLSMHFGGVRAVRHVNFSLAEGELRCLIGPNGAGKSTFFKMLTGQLEPTEGQVLFRGRDISHAHAHDIARLGIGINQATVGISGGKPSDRRTRNRLCLLPDWENPRTTIVVHSQSTWHLSHSEPRRNDTLDFKLVKVSV